MWRAIVLLGVSGAFSCASTSASVAPGSSEKPDDPEELRPGYGDNGLRVWSPLAPPEIAALRGIEDAKRGDARALLALGIVASGDQRDAASYARLAERADQFVAAIRPAVDGAADDWHRGYELHRAMHRLFFNGERTDLGRYDFNQQRITGVFAEGRYNCLSSAMLFVVVARAFHLPVRGVLVPTHVFVEMGTPGGKIIEIETTSGTGFDWVHDDRFYREEAAGWSGRRGLRPVTLEEYQHRTILEPYQLMALAMRDPRAGRSDGDRMRLRELAALVAPGDPELARDRVMSYVNESVDLLKVRAWRTTVKLFDTVGADVLSEAIATSRDAKTLELTSWANWSYANALMKVGRSDESIARMSDGFDRLDATWPDAAKLRNNYLVVLNDRLCQLIDKRAYPEALKVVTRHREACRSDKVCASNIGVVYGNWSIDHQNAGDWQAARQVLKECVTVLPEDGRCRDALADLESRHRF